MLKKIGEAVHNYSDMLISKIVYYFGMTAVVGSVGNGVVSNTFTAKLMTPELWGLADYAAVVGIFAGVTMSIQRMVDMYLAIRKSNSVDEINQEQAMLIEKLSKKLFKDEENEENEDKLNKQ